MEITKRDLFYIGIGEAFAFLLQQTGAIRMPMQSITIDGLVITWPFYFTLHAAIFIIIIYAVCFLINVVRSLKDVYRSSRPPEKLKRLEKEVKELGKVLSAAGFGSICEEPKDGEQTHYYSCAKKIYEEIEKICHTKRPHPEMYGRFFSEILLSVRAGEIENVRIISELPYLQTPLLHEFHEGRKRNNDQETREG